MTPEELERLEKSVAPLMRPVRLTAPQAEIVRRFVAGEDLDKLFASGVSSWAYIESALRAALVEKDATIERLP